MFPFHRWKTKRQAISVACPLYHDITLYPELTDESLAHLEVDCSWLTHYIDGAAKTITHYK